MPGWKSLHVPRWRMKSFRHHRPGRRGGMPTVLYNRSSRRMLDEKKKGTRGAIESRQPTKDRVVETSQHALSLPRYGDKVPGYSIISRSARARRTSHHHTTIHPSYFGTWGSYGGLTRVSGTCSQNVAGRSLRHKG